MKSSKKIPHPVIPVVDALQGTQAGIQLFKHVMDSRLRGNDKNEPKFNF